MRIRFRIRIPNTGVQDRKRSEEKEARKIFASLEGREVAPVSLLVVSVEAGRDVRELRQAARRGEGDVRQRGGGLSHLRSIRLQRFRIEPWSPGKSKQVVDLVNFAVLDPFLRYIFFVNGVGENIRCFSVRQQKWRPEQIQIQLLHTYNFHLFFKLYLNKQLVPIYRGFESKAMHEKGAN